MHQTQTPLHRSVGRALVFTALSLAAIGVLALFVFGVWSTLNIIVWSTSAPSLFELPTSAPTALLLTALAATFVGVIGLLPAGFTALWEIATCLHAPRPRTVPVPERHT